MIQYRHPTLIICDLESERDLNWGNDIVIKTLDTNKFWKIVAAAYVEITGASRATLVKADVGLSNVSNIDTTTTANITDSTNKRFLTDTQQTVITNTSGTNSGDNAVNTLYSGLVTNANHTGDATGATALTLATVNSNIGSFGSATQAPVVTVNAKGLVTAATNTTIQIAESQVTNLTSDLALKAPLISPTLVTPILGVATATTINGAILSNALGTTVFLRGDGTYATPPGGSGTFTITQIEVDFGVTPISENIFTISDGIVTSSSKIIANLAYDIPTGKDLDELEMDCLDIKCGNASTGQFQMFIKASDGSYLHDKFKINYTIA